MREKIKYKPAASTEWSTQPNNFKTKYMVNIDFTLPDFSAKKIVTWKCHVDESTEGQYDMIIGRELLTSLGINIKFYDNTIECSEGPYQG